jgi:hypothetical protein
MSDLPIVTERSSPIRIRAHTLLCLQGFRGEGYNAAFVENMTAIDRMLAEHPESMVEVLSSPDALCTACPHRRTDGCTLHGEDSEEDMRQQDSVVLKKLGLKTGDRVTWHEIVDRIRRAVSGDDLSSICGDCRWLPLGYCREGIERLRSNR